MNWVKYKNGNYEVLLNIDNGTKIRYNEEDSFLPDRPESIDVKISNDCEHGCSFCHEDSYYGGRIADLKDVEKFAKSLPPYTEIALGGGNLMKNPEHTQICLRIFKKYKAIVSITVLQYDFIHSNNIIRKWYNDKLIHGIGISLTNAVDNRLWNLYLDYKTAIIHTIAGLLSINDIAYLMIHHARVLILGYKQFGRGYDCYQKNKEEINCNILTLKSFIPKLMKRLEVCSFDNLALEQLDIQSQVDKDTWDTYYMGNDGTTTFYVDLVNMEYAISSISNRQDIINNDCLTMFNSIKEMRV